MANVLANIARVVSATTGTGTLTLGAAVQGFNTFADAGITDGQTVTYAIEDYTADVVSAREVGTGVFNTAGPTLTRATVYSSTSGGAKINCSGSQQVFITAAKEDFDSFLTATTAASTYQPLDSDLTTLAANITTFGHSLVDDADNTAARTTLGLGTAAVKDTGTSGNTVPLLDGTNTWSAGTVQTFGSGTATGAAVDIFLDTAFGAPLALVSSDASASRGPNLLFRRTSPSPAVSDDGGAFLWQMNDDAANILSVATVGIRASSVTSGAFSGTLRFQTMQAGALALRAQLGAGLVVGSPTGSDTGAGTINAVTLYENGTSLAAKYQGLDSELTAIAGLTSAADRLPYFTGSGTASLATFTTAGRNLVDDADASAQRTTLGLGTAATQNTGTSGANLPFMNGANTWSAAQTVSVSTLVSNFLAESTDSGAGAGPFMTVRRASASPAISDLIGVFNFQGRDDAANNTNYCQLAAVIVNPADTAEESTFTFNTMNAGTLDARMTIYKGAKIGSPTGGDKGTGTLNAVAVYDDSVLLCAPVEYMKSGTVNTAMWDGYAIDEYQPEAVNEELVEIDVQLSEPETVIERQRDGTFKRVTVTSKKATPLDAFPVLNEKGEQVDTAWVPQTVRKVRPAKTIKRRNELAHEFKAMLDEGFDPRDPKAYFDKMLADEALPGLKTKANWVPNEESNAKRTNRIIMALELQTAAFKTVYEQVEALKAEVASLKAKR